MNMNIHEDRNTLLFFMCITYFGAIYHICRNYERNGSISNIIGNEECNQTILGYMILMGIGTLIYEYTRNDKVSLFCIIGLLIGIYGILFFDETTYYHYLFATLIFFSIFGFMVSHCDKKKDIILYFMLFLQVFFILGIFIFLLFPSICLFDFFCGEVCLVINFAVFYLYLHFFSPQVETETTIFKDASFGGIDLCYLHHQQINLLPTAIIERNHPPNITDLPSIQTAT